MKNIWIEGLQGMGKSTLLERISSRIPALHVCREGDYSPVELAWCTWMTEGEYRQMLERYGPIREEVIKHTVREESYYIVTYTRILTEIPGFHKYLGEYEIYNGRKSIKELEEIICCRYWNFHDTGYLFEASFFQNIMEDMILFHERSDEQIMAFYRKLYGGIAKDNFLMLYLYSDQVEETIDVIRKERCDDQGNEMWYSLMMGFLIQSPYGRRHDYKDFSDLAAHLRHRQGLELRIIKEMFGERAMILPAKKWNLEEVLSFIS
ncbi:MAG: hypothetical protein HFI62_09520 [Lachnospiraceae bacterium]|jgi:hypothetical protein|nr:hypothetical protein [Lachnospiraceae bacterium]